MAGSLITLEGRHRQADPLLRWVLALVMLAIGLRAVYCATCIDPRQGPTVGGNDDWQYDWFATTLLEGRGMANEAGAASAQRTPGYPLFLAVIYAVFGKSYLAVRLVQCVFGGVSCLLLYLLANRWTSARVGLLAAGILCVYPMHIWLAGELLSENVLVPGLLAVMLSLDRARRVPTLGRCVVAGLTGGLVALVHPIMAGLVLVLSGGLCARAIVFRRATIGISTATLLVAATFVGGWGLRNRFAVGSFALSSLGGSTFLGANNVVTATDPSYHGYWIGEWEVPGVRQEIGHVRDEMVRSRMFGQWARRWLLDHPGYWPRLVAFKLLRFYGPFLNDWRSPIGLLYLFSYGALLPFIGAATWGTWRHRWIQDRFAVWTLMTVLGYYTAVVVVFWGAPRFRLTIDPILILLAATAAIRVGQAVRRRLPHVPGASLPSPRFQAAATDV
ncbi:MAG: glycosyltransferase family 39 protein [Phycisphaerae bacterium]|nr:glycosyltransferase family 39 protein [Phycisphaerae bacterium]